jgi:hypothetical protein
MAGSTIEHRRRVRAAETARDKLLEQNTKNRTLLAKARAELKSLRGRKS